MSGGNSQDPSPERWALMRGLYAELRELPSADRASMLDARCAGDAELKAEVLDLLNADSESEAFMSPPTCGSAGTLAPRLQTGALIGPYTLVQHLGEGTFGDVFIAQQSQPLRRRVALKLVKAGMSSRQILARFMLERQSLAVMDHPGIARVYDAGTTDAGQPYFVMELVDGLPITAFADRHCLSIPERLALFIQVCQAVDHANSRGIIHRDLKPSNVLVAQGDHGLVAKVIDFGIAKATAVADPPPDGDAHAHPADSNSPHTEHRAVLGTPEYMSPEQVAHQDTIDSRSDVYALGVLLYQLLSGTLPFDGARLRAARLEEMHRIIQFEQPPEPGRRVSQLHPDARRKAAACRNLEAAALEPAIAGELTWIAMKAIAKRPDDRYQSPNWLAQDVRRHLSGDLVHAAPASAMYRARKYMRKRRSFIAGAALVCAALVMGVLSTLWQASEANVRALESGDQRALVARGSRIAEARRLVVLANQAAEDAPQRRALIALAAAETTDHTQEGCLPEAVQALSDAVYALGGAPLCGHTGEVTCVRVSPVAAIAFTASMDGTVRVWNISTAADGKPGALPSAPPGADRLLATITPEHGAVLDIDVSPDGARLATAHQGGTAALWDVTVPRQPRLDSLLQGHARKVRAVQFNALGTQLATASSDGSARIWDLTADDPSADPQVLAGHTDEVLTVDFSPDGSTVMTGSMDGTARAWRVGADLSRQALGPQASGGTWVRLAKYSPDGQHVLAAERAVGAMRSDSPTLPQWTFRTNPLQEADAPMSGAFSSDSRFVAAGDGAGLVRVWDLHAPDIERSVRILRGHSGPVNAVTFCPSGECVATAGIDHTIRLWNVHDADPNLSQVVLRGHDKDVRSLSFSGNGATLVSGSSDGTARVWDLARAIPECSVQVFRGHPGVPVHTVEFSPSGDDLVTSADDGRALLWNVHDTTGHAHGDARLTSSNALRGAWLSPGGTHLVALDTESTLRFSELGDPSETAQFEEAIREGSPFVAAWHPDGAQFVVAGFGGTCTMWSTRTGVPRKVRSFNTGHDRSIACVAYSADGAQLATTAEDTVAMVWRFQSDGSPLLPLQLRGHTGWVRSADFNPEGTLLVTASADRTARVWRLDAGLPSESPQVLTGHQDWVSDAKFSPDGTRIATASHDGTIRLWRLPHGGLGKRFVQERVIRAQVAPSTGLAFSPDGRRLASIAKDSTIRVWDLDMHDLCDRARELVGRELTAEERAGVFGVGGSDD